MAINRLGLGFFDFDNQMTKALLAAEPASFKLDNQMTKALLAAEPASFKLDNQMTKALLAAEPASVKLANDITKAFRAAGPSFVRLADSMTAALRAVDTRPAWQKTLDDAIGRFRSMSPSLRTANVFVDTFRNAAIEAVGLRFPRSSVEAAIEASRGLTQAQTRAVSRILTTLPPTLDAVQEVVESTEEGTQEDQIERAIAALTGEVAKLRQAFVDRGASLRHAHALAATYLGVLLTLLSMVLEPGWVDSLLQDHEQQSTEHTEMIRMLGDLSERVGSNRDALEAQTEQLGDLAAQLDDLQGPVLMAPMEAVRVTLTRVQVRSQPKKASATVTTLPAGAFVVEVERKKRWLLISFPDDKGRRCEGWVEPKSVAAVVTSR